MLCLQSRQINTVHLICLIVQKQQFAVLWKVKAGLFPGSEQLADDQLTQKSSVAHNTFCLNVTFRLVSAFLKTSNYSFLCLASLGV